MLRSKQAALKLILAALAALAVASGVYAAYTPEPTLRTISVNKFDELQFTFGPKPRDCSTTSLVKTPLKIVLKMGNTTYVANSAQFWCGLEGGGPEWGGHGNTWRLYYEDPGTVVQLRPYNAPLGKTRRVWSYWVSAGRSDGQGTVIWKLLRKGRVRVYTNAAKRDGRIWEDEDNFVNICINGHYTIRSSGGRLYCSLGRVGNVFDWSIKILR